MGMDSSSTRVFVQTFAHRAVHDIQKEGFHRELRGYVDMCSILANGTMQKAFFERAQKLLQKADSLYYGLVQRMVGTVAEDRICTVGVNLGFNGLMYGASRLKTRAQQTGEAVSWLNLALCGDPALETLVTRAEAGGSYVWMLDARQPDPQVFGLAARHGQCVFFLALYPQMLDDALIEALAACDNIVALLILDGPELSETARAATCRLRKEKLFYGVTVCLDDGTAPQAVNALWLEVLAREALFCIYTRRSGMDPEISEQLKKEIYRSRTASGVPVLLLDGENDVGVLNRYVAPGAVVADHLPAGADARREPG